MRRLVLAALLAAPFVIGQAIAEPARSIDRTNDRRCREAGYRAGTPAYARCRATVSETGSQRSGRRPVIRGSSSPPPPDIIRPRGFSPPPVVGIPPPVVVTPSLPDRPTIIDAPPPPGVVRGLDPPPVVRTPPPIILGPAAPSQPPGLLPVPSPR